MALLQFTQFPVIKESKQSYIKSRKFINGNCYSLFWEQNIILNQLNNYENAFDIALAPIADLFYFNFSKELEKLNILADKIKEEENYDI